MTITPTWDLLVIVCFVIIVAYSYIIGKNGTIKVILSSYIAILTSNGLGNIIGIFLANRPFISFLPDNYGISTMALIKMMIFIIVTILLVLRGAFEIHLERERYTLMALLSNLTYGILSGGLIVSTLLIYLTGTNINGIIASSSEIQQITSIEFVSPVISNLIKNYSIWFTAPAIIFMLHSFITNRPETEVEV